MNKTRRAVVAIALTALAVAATSAQPDTAPAVVPVPLSGDGCAAARDTALTVRWFGTSTILVGDGTHQILIDGFFSRPSWTQLLVGRLGPDAARITAALAAGHVCGPIDALLVAHSHHDHAMDSAVVARRTGAVLYGSASALNVGAAAGAPGDGVTRIRLAEPRDRFHVPHAAAEGDGFEVQTFVTPHSPHALFPGHIDAPLPLPARIWQFKVDVNHSFVLRHRSATLLIVPSAGRIEAGTFDGVCADVVLLGIGTLGRQSDGEVSRYWAETVVKTHAKLVIPIHWDDFTRPLDEPLRAMPLGVDDVPAALRALQRLAADCGVEVHVPAVFEALPLPLPRADALPPVRGTACPTPGASSSAKPGA